MNSKQKNSNLEHSELQVIDVSSEQMKRLARQMLPEIKRFFTDEAIRQEFEKWKEKRSN